MSITFDPSALTKLKNTHGSISCLGQAAVLVGLVEQANGYFLLLTKRAINMTHHGGEIAFPGGMWEPGDHFPTMTALREAHEEVALEPTVVSLQGSLSTTFSRNGTEVVPVVGLIPENLTLIASPSEIEDVFYVPIDVLLADQRIRTDVFNRGGKIHWVPAYDYQGHEIWGLTARVIMDLLSRCFGASFDREHSAPEKIWTPR